VDEADDSLVVETIGCAASAGAWPFVVAVAVKELARSKLIDVEVAVEEEEANTEAMIAAKG
jgi:hypothetical protein